MRLNLQNAGVQACKALSTNEHFIVFTQVIHDLAQEKANLALDASAENQPSSIGYARCMRDLFVAMVAASSSVPHNVVKVPGAVKNAS